jgi:hypothetical protein
MELESSEQVQLSACAAGQLSEYVDGQLNGGARREFADATSETQESGADLDEGSAYLDDSVVEFTPQSVACGLCKGAASLSAEGSVDAPKCRVSGSCELEWTKKYPHAYRTADGGMPTSGLICGAELGCTALIKFVDTDGSLQPEVVAGVCLIVERGAHWLETREKALQSAVLFDPEAGIAAFDGEGSGREATE